MKVVGQFLFHIVGLAVLVAAVAREASLPSITGVVVFFLLFLLLVVAVCGAAYLFIKLEGESRSSKPCSADKVSKNPREDTKWNFKLLGSWYASRFARYGLFVGSLSLAVFNPRLVLGVWVLWLLLVSIQWWFKWKAQKFDPSLVSSGPLLLTWCTLSLVIDVWVTAKFGVSTMILALILLSGLQFLLVKGASEIHFLLVNGASEIHHQVATVVGNRRSRLYHSFECPASTNIFKHRRAFFKDEREAQKAGFESAKHCCVRN